MEPNRERAEPASAGRAFDSAGWVETVGAPERLTRPEGRIFMVRGQPHVSKTFDLVIFGGTGDLSRRKLLPALYNGLGTGAVSAGSRIFLTSRRALDGDVSSWLAEVLESFPPACGVDPAGLEAFSSVVQVVQLDLDEATAGWGALREALPPNPDRPLVNFLAVPPKAFASTCRLLGQHGLAHAHSRVVVEKPLGHDRASAELINTEIGEHFDESQTFRIDHYLGKEAVQNLIALRFGNFIFEKLWNASCIDHIQITIAEQDGVEGRGQFYEGVGAMRDMVQNHVLQLLCLVAMEPPARLDGDRIREEKLKVLRVLEPIEAKDIHTRVVRGRYEAGAVGGQAVAGYASDLGLDGSSATETFVAIEAHIHNWRWAGVPFYLRTGKRMPARFAEIAIQFKNLPIDISDSMSGRITPNRFIISLQPQDRLGLRMMVKNNDSTKQDLKEVELDLDMTCVGGTARLGPYLRLILDAVEGDQRLFVHRDEVELAWAWVDGIIAHWDRTGESPIPYTAGTWGPYEAHDLVKRAGREWSRGLGPPSGSKS